MAAIEERKLDSLSLDAIFLSNLPNELDETTNAAGFPILEPNQNDVLLGRGGRNNRHSGNNDLRQLAHGVWKKYHAASKREKPLIAEALVENIRDQTPSGRFLKYDTSCGEWKEVSFAQAREKACQCLRDTVAIMLKTKKCRIPNSSILVSGKVPLLPKKDKSPKLPLRHGDSPRESLPPSRTVSDEFEEVLKTRTQATASQTMDATKTFVGIDTGTTISSRNQERSTNAFDAVNLQRPQPMQACSPQDRSVTNRGLTYSANPRIPITSRSMGNNMASTITTALNGTLPTLINSAPTTFSRNQLKTMTSLDNQLTVNPHRIQNLSTSFSACNFTQSAVVNPGRLTAHPISPDAFDCGLALTRITQRPPDFETKPNQKKHYTRPNDTISGETSKSAKKAANAISLCNVMGLNTVRGVGLGEKGKSEEPDLFSAEVLEGITWEGEDISSVSHCDSPQQGATEGGGTCFRQHISQLLSEIEMLEDS